MRKFGIPTGIDPKGHICEMANLYEKLQDLIGVIAKKSASGKDFDGLYAVLKKNPPESLQSKKAVVGEGIVKQHLKFLEQIGLVDKDSNGKFSLTKQGEVASQSSAAYRDIVFNMSKDFLGSKGIRYEDLLSALDESCPIESRSRDALYVTLNNSRNGMSGSDFGKVLSLLKEAGEIQELKVAYFGITTKN